LEKLNAGEITPEELENISTEMDAAFEENCKNTLTNDEYQLVFGDTSDKTTEKPSDTKNLKELIEQEITPEESSKEKETQE